MHIPQFTMIFKYHILSIATYYNFNWKGDKQMTNFLTRAELLDLCEVLVTSKVLFKEHAESWRRLGLDMEYGGRIPWDDDVKQCTKLLERIHEVLDS